MYFISPVTRLAGRVFLASYWMFFFVLIHKTCFSCSVRLCYAEYRCGDEQEDATGFHGVGSLEVGNPLRKGVSIFLCDDEEVDLMFTLLSLGARL